MRKKGFTLSEVLIAMSIIGILAALTIPTFVSSGRNRANATKLSTIISAVENAFTSMLASEGYPDLAETDFGVEPNATNLGKYLKLAGSKEKLKDYYGTDSPFMTIDNTSFQPGVTRIFETKNGAYLIYQTSAVSRSIADVQKYGGAVTDSIGILTIDVNGKAKPNVWGRDTFYFRIGDKGLLYPAGGKIFSILEKNSDEHLWNVSSSDYKCVNDVKKIGCTARLIENNFEVDF